MAARSRSGVRYAVVATISPLLLATPAFAQQDCGLNFTNMLPELGVLFVVATLLESALALLFNWRVFKTLFNGRALKDVIMFAIALAIVKGFNYDLFGRVLQDACALGQTKCPSHAGVSQTLSAAVLGGGSAAVNQILRTLGFRPSIEGPEVGPKPERDKAWVSILVERARSIGPAEILWEEIQATAAAPSEALLAVACEKGQAARWRDLFLADAMRTPSYGGRTVEAGKLYRISFNVLSKSANPGEPPTPGRWPTFERRFAGGAIIDPIVKL